jgi:hypothetical protein
VLRLMLMVVVLSFVSWVVLLVMQSIVKSSQLVVSELDHYRLLRRAAATPESSHCWWCSSVVEVRSLLLRLERRSCATSPSHHSRYVKRARPPRAASLCMRRVCRSVCSCRRG